MRDCLQSLFGNSVLYRQERLPDNVHGPRAALPEAEGKAAARFKARLADWRPLARDLADEPDGCHVLVQAAMWYDGKPDDPVNKLAGRCALATDANANVQYLLPPGGAVRGLKDYLNRIQSAVYDLVFGHSGLVSGIASLATKIFPDAATRPRAVMGLSVVSQANTKRGSGGRICLATRIDIATGETSGRIGWFKGHMRWSSSWKPFFDILKDVADLSVTGIGDSKEAENSFGKFVRAMIDEAAAAGDKPLVLVDSTSASGLWSWLKDAEISGPLVVGNERIEAGTRWSGVRLVRIRVGHAARIVLRKSMVVEQVDQASGERIDLLTRYAPTITSRSIRIGSGNHFWSTSSYLDQVTRGLSVYRPLSGLVKATAADGAASGKLFKEVVFDLTGKPYRTPNPLEITVARMEPSDSANRIAWMVDSLRYGYGHTMAMTALPAPLSFESKVRDYMARFALEDADISEDVDPNAAETDEAEPDEAALDLADATVGGDGPPAWTDALFPQRTEGAAAPESPVGDILSKLTNSAKQKTYRQNLLGGYSEADRMAEHKPKAMAQDGKFLGQPSSGDWSTPVGNNVRLDDLGDILGVPPVAPPKFVTLAWVAQTASMPPSRIRLMHEHVEAMLNVYPDLGWPRDRKPTQDEALLILLRGFSQPLIYLALGEGLGGSASEMFERFRTRTARMIGPKSPAKGRLGRSFRGIINALVEAGEFQTAADCAVVEAVTGLDFEAVLAGIVDKPELAEVGNYLKSVSENWKDFNNGFKKVEAVNNKGNGEKEGWDTVPLPPDDAGDGSAPQEALLPGETQDQLEPTRMDMKTPEPAAESKPVQRFSAPVPSREGPIAEALLAWRSAMGEIGAAIDDLPSGLVVDALEKALSTARDACAAYLAALPKLVDVTPLVQRLRVIALQVAQAGELFAESELVRDGAHAPEASLPPYRSRNRAGGEHGRRAEEDSRRMA